MTRFPAVAINRLRQRAREIAATGQESPARGSRQPVDPMEVVAVFPPLRVREGFVLRAVPVGDGRVAGLRVRALPLDPAGPPSALDDFMAAVCGDGSPWSYLCASVLARELSALGADQPRGSWRTHVILGSDPWGAAGDPDGRSMLGAASAPAAEWRWVRPRPLPGDWQPRVVEQGRSVTVELVTWSTLGGEAIYRSSDWFERGDYRFLAKQAVVATGRGSWVQ